MRVAAGVGDVDMVRRLFDQVSTSPVDGCLALRLEELLPSGVRLRAPIPRGPGSAGDVGIAVGLSVICDAAGGWATALAQGSELSGPTIELRVDHAWPPADDARWMIAESRLRHTVGEAASITVDVVDEQGRELAHAQGHFVLDTPGAGAQPQEWATFDGVVLDRPDELLAALAGRPEADPDKWTVTATPQLANPRGQVHGGVLMAIGQLAQRRAQVEWVPRVKGNVERAAPSPLSIQVDYLRPAMADGSELSCDTEYLRNGRRFRTLHTELTRQDGRVAATVTGLWSVA
ncbi:MAG TPA: acyl-CoA thioesterase domain-containing protein [Pseudonocardia sp.]|jgi:uncharacterized protein (TIGR00369 family)|uniref:PaaI family thioesterase n=1 Tax=Pseudonocardia sp. TaxID=60912 RepID=UPI002F3EE2C1